MQTRLWRNGVCSLVALGWLLCGSAAARAQTIIGAGSTFVQPAMSQWIADYEKITSGSTIDYQSVGSGAGIERYKQGSVDFAATDAPLTDAELAGMPTPTLHVPVIAGAVVLAFNLPGFPNELRMTGDMIADIYLGKITHWNDPRLQRENPSFKLPPTLITPVHRYDGSGTTYILTDYLSAVSPDWKAGPGRGRNVKWPVGSGLPGNEGVAERVLHTAGSIGYVELAYAIPRNMHYVSIKNAAGNYVRPSIESIEVGADAALLAMKRDVRVSIVNGKATDAYPIIGFTYLLVPKKSRDAHRSAMLAEFVKWILGPGQQVVRPLKYAPLPPVIASLSRNSLNQVKVR